MSCKPVNTSDKNIEILQVFYKQYIIEQSKMLDNKREKIDSLKSIYCSNELLTTLSKLELDYDPYLDAQDCDESDLKRMSIEIENADSAIYRVMFAIINPAYTRRIIRLKMADGKIVGILDR